MLMDVEGVVEAALESIVASPVGVRGVRVVRLVVSTE